MPDGRFSNKHLELVYTKYEVNRSIIKDGRCIQPFNPVFSTLTPGWAGPLDAGQAGRGEKLLQEQRG